MTAPLPESSVDRAWQAFNKEIANLEEKAIEAEVRGSAWLADGNAAKERGNQLKSEKCYAKAQYWLDRYNKFTGRSS